MSITLERSESWETEVAVAPKPVLSKQTFANFIANKAVKGVTWDDSSYNNWMAIEFTDKSRFIISDNVNGPNLRYVPPPVKKK